MQLVSAYHLYGKTSCSGGKSNGTVLSSGNFSGKKEYLQRYSSLLVFTKMIEISLYHLLLDETRSLFPVYFFTRALLAFGKISKLQLIPVLFPSVRKVQYHL